ncbi:MAG: hypothetical protein KDD59_14120, partial [Bdellovibrionales bacterium]|nr:hypothetical protein [Bdellovibrionales bacterium]
MYRVLLLLLVTTGPLVGCGRPPESQPHPADRNRFERMTPQEQQQVAPNPLFVSIYKGDLEEVRVHADRSSTLLEQKNAVHGDTPLAVAIRLRERAIANEIILRMSVDSLRHKNDTGESYIYLASQQGFNDVIENLASKYEQSLGTFDVFDFSELDQETDSLERALFVALNAETAKTLQHYWFLGATHFEHPFNDFFHHRDLSLRTFLHRAAQENRFDVILWAADKTCGSNSWQDPDSFFLKRFAGHVW